MKTLVSVIVPIYKAEKTLPDCINSILNQTYSDLELLLVDDGSPDNCGKLCDEYAAKDSRIRVFHQENGGASSARNCGMDNALGEHFVCIDSDDVIEPCYLEDLVMTQQAHPEWGHVVSGFRCTSHVHDYIYSDKEALSVLDRKDYMPLFDKILVQSPCLALYRTEIVQKNNIRMRVDLSLAEDILFNLAYLDALDNTTICVVNKANYIYQNEDQNSLYRKYRHDLLSINEAVNSEIKHYLIKWEIKDDTSWTMYYDASFYKYINVLDNTFSPLNPMTKQEKIAYNNAIMEKESFREALNKCTVNITPAMKKAYLSGDYRQVLQVKRIGKLKSFVRGIVNV